MPVQDVTCSWISYGYELSLELNVCLLTFILVQWLVNVLVFLEMGWNVQWYSPSILSTAVLPPVLVSMQYTNIIDLGKKYILINSIWNHSKRNISYLFFEDKIFCWYYV
jgi:hypothetical protein